MKNEERGTQRHTPTKVRERRSAKGRDYGVSLGETSAFSGRKLRFHRHKPDATLPFSTQRRLWFFAFFVGFCPPVELSKIFCEFVLGLALHQHKSD